MAHRARILLVEDDPVQASLLGKILGAEGHEVVLAADGIEAIARAMDCRPDLVLLDIRIPGLDGYEVALRLRAEPAISRIPILAVSAHGDVQIAKAVGCDDLIQKPIDAKALRERLGRVLESRRHDPARGREEPDILAAKGGEIVEKLRLKIEELEAAKGRIEALEKARAEFYRNVSHELFTPLTPSMGYVSLLLDGKLGKLTPEQIRAARAIEKSLSRMRLLVEDLLDVTALQMGRIPVQARTFEALPLLVEVARAHEEESRGKQVEVLITVLPIRTVRICTDRDKLGRIVHHLLGNAVKFSAVGGMVALTLSTDQEGIGLDVYDDGPGVSADMIDRIFEPFFQVDGSVTREHGGMGLGLPIVRRLAVALGGTAWAESPPVDKGSVPGTAAGGRGFLARVKIPSARATER